MLPRPKIVLTGCITAIFVLCFLFLVLPQSDALAGDSRQIALTGDEQSLIDVINEARVRYGLPPFKVDYRLVQAARLKASLDGSSRYIGKLVRDAGVRYSSIGQVSGKTANINLIARILTRYYPKYLIYSKKYDRIGAGVLERTYLKPFSVIFVGGGGQEAIPPGQGTGDRPQPQPAPDPCPEPGPQSQPQPNPWPHPQPQPEPRPQPQPEPQPQPQLPAGQLTADETQMFNLVNQERQRAGVRPLQIDMQLVKLARLKAQDMIDKGYFSHTSPTYGSPFEMMRSFGVTYRYAGENLAGAPTVGIAHRHLMNSPGHRANILNSNFTKVGIGVVDGGPYGKMFVQMFTG